MEIDGNKQNCVCAFKINTGKIYILIKMGSFFASQMGYQMVSFKIVTPVNEMVGRC